MPSSLSTRQALWPVKSIMRLASEVSMDFHAPNSFVLTASISLRWKGSQCRRYPIWRVFLFFSAAAIMRAQSSAVGAIGFSQITCFPASKARMVNSGCSAVGVTT